MRILTILIGLEYILLCILDIKNRRVPIFLVIAAGISVLIKWIVCVCVGELKIYDTILSVIPGCICLVLSLVFPKRIGTGDGLVLIITEIGKTLSQSMLSLTVTMFMVSFVSLFVITGAILTKRKTNIQLPFIPFIMLGTTVMNAFG